VVFHEKPLLKFERLLETHYAFAPRVFRVDRILELKVAPCGFNDKL
jgi:hypothetical protein